MTAKQEIADLTAELIAWKMEADALRQEIARLREWLNVTLPGEAPKEQDGDVDRVNPRARIIIDQIVAARLASREGGVDLRWLEQQLQSLLERLYAEEYSAAHLRGAPETT